MKRPKIVSNKFCILKYQITIFAVFIIIVIFYSFNGCKDNPVTPTKKTPGQGVDTVDKYNWTRDTIPYLVQDFYVADSNNIFLQGNVGMVYYNGITNKPIYFSDPSFYANCIAGYDKNNVFLGGGDFDGNVLDSIYPGFLIWNGATFTHYYVPKDPLIQWGGVNNILVLGPSDIWISSTGHFVFHFQSGNLTQYPLDSGVIGYGVLFKDPIGIIYLFSNSSNPDPNYFRNNAYRFDGTKFHLILTDSSNGSTDMWLGIYPCGNDIIRGGAKSLYYFNSINWTILCGTNNTQVVAAGGTSKNDVIFWSGPLYFWNGIKLSTEKSWYNAARGMKIACSYIYEVDKKIYINMYNPMETPTYLVIGKPK